MMSKEELIQNPFYMDDRQQVEYFEHLYSDMAHDKGEKIDVDDYESDYENFWALKELRRHHFQYFFSFYGICSLALAYYDFLSSGNEVNFTNFIFVVSGIFLLSFSGFIHNAHLRHEKDLLKYRHKRILAG